MEWSIAIALGAAGLALALYLVSLLRRIRKGGFGEGQTVVVPEAGIAFRCPSWWRRTEEPPGAAAGASTGGGPVRILTGNHSGALTIETLPREAAPARPPGAAETRLEKTGLAGRLDAIVASRGLVLDETEIHEVPLAGEAGAGGGRQAWAASAGRESAHAEARAYLELHLVEVPGRPPVLFSYVNGVLHGFLDAYYLERVVATVVPEPPGPPAPVDRSGPSGPPGSPAPPSPPVPPASSAPPTPPAGR